MKNGYNKWRGAKKRKYDIKKSAKMLHFRKISKSKIGESFKYVYMKNRIVNAKKKLQKTTIGERVGLPSQKGLL